MSITLTEKVYTALAVERPNEVDSHNFPRRTDDARLTQFELDCRDWGLAYGLAWAIARSEDPFESVESVSTRAIAAARDAYARWGGTDIFTPLAFERDRAARTEIAEAVA